MKKTGLVLLLAALAIIFVSGCAGPAMPELEVVKNTDAPTDAPAADPTAAPAADPTAVPTDAPTDAPADEPTAGPTAVPPPAPLTVSNRALVYTNGYIDVDIACPEISGMQDALVQGNINSNLYSYFLGQAESTEQASEDDEASFGPHGVYTASSEYVVMRNDGIVLSIKMTSDMYTGGAHPFSQLATLNLINTDPSAQPSFEDLFLPGTDYITVVNDWIDAEIAADPASADAFWFDTVSAHQMYCLTDTSVVVLFDAYEIAPGAYGPIEFEIPMSSLAGMLISDIL